MPTIKERIKNLAEANGETLASIEKKLEIGNGTIGRWDVSAPTADRLQAIADYFDVSVDYLLGRESEEMDDVMVIRERLRRRPETKMLFNATEKATAEQIIAVAEMIEKWKT